MKLEPLTEEEIKSWLDATNNIWEYDETNLKTIRRLIYTCAQERSEKERLEWHNKHASCSKVCFCDGGWDREKWTSAAWLNAMLKRWGWKEAKQ